jgi:type III secretion system FlhB-like substrate exporter
MSRRDSEPGNSGKRSAKPPRAVALRYDDQREDAPSLRAKGRGEVAQRILELAKKNDVRSVVNRIS